MNNNADFRKEWKVNYKCDDPEKRPEWDAVRFAYVTADSADEAGDKVKRLFNMFKTDIIGVPQWTGDMSDAEF